MKSGEILKEKHRIKFVDDKKVLKVEEVQKTYDEIVGVDEKNYYIHPAILRSLVTRIRKRKNIDVKSIFDVIEDWKKERRQKSS